MNKLCTTLAEQRAFLKSHHQDHNPGQTGVTFIDLRDIVFVEAKSNYADLVLADKRRILISKTLKDIQFVLEQQQFLRIHRQYIINLNEVKHLNRNESLLTMTTGDVLPVSRLQKDKLTEQYGWLWKMVGEVGVTSSFGGKAPYPADTPKDFKDIFKSKQVC